MSVFGRASALAIGVALSASGVAWGQASLEAIRRNVGAPDRGLVAPHAQTQPAGTTALDAYQIIVATMTHAPTDRFQVSLTAFVIPAAGILQGKGVILRTDRVVASVAGGVAYAGDGIEGVLGGPLVDVLIDDAGFFSAHAAAFVTLRPADRVEYFGRDPLFVDLGLTAGASSDVAVLIEVKWLRTEDTTLANGSMGLRLGWTDAALDLGFALNVDGATPLFLFTFRD